MTEKMIRRFNGWKPLELEFGMEEDATFSDELRVVTDDIAQGFNSEIISY